jgi:hypothetical protein
MHHMRLRGRLVVGRRPEFGACDAMRCDATPIGCQRWLLSPFTHPPTTHLPSSFFRVRGGGGEGWEASHLLCIRGARALYLTSDTAACYDEHAMPCHAVIPELGPEVSESRP